MKIKKMKTTENENIELKIKIKSVTKENDSSYTRKYRVWERRSRSNITLLIAKTLQGK